MRYLYRINHVETGGTVFETTLAAAKACRLDMLRISHGGTVTIVRKPDGKDAPWKPLSTKFVLTR